MTYYSEKRNTFILNFYTLHQFGWLAERGGQLFKFASESVGYPNKRGGAPSEKGGFQAWRKLWIIWKFKSKCGLIYFICLSCVRDNNEDWVYWVVVVPAGCIYFVPFPKVSDSFLFRFFTNIGILIFLVGVGSFNF